MSTLGSSLSGPEGVPRTWAAEVALAADAAGICVIKSACEPDPQAELLWATLVDDVGRHYHLEVLRRSHPFPEGRHATLVEQLRAQRPSP
jgi:hypothetical protein